ncbi:MAG: hypothetical protein M3R70_13605 [Actinomycetota bacterium]|nr:hypothetical protein [Actinomycetota bacterium]
MVELGWHTAPACIQHGVSPADGIFKPYEKCADFFTFGPGSTLGTVSSGTNWEYYVLVAIGFTAMIAFIVAWVWTEDRKLRAQAAYLLTSGMAGDVRIRREDVPRPGTGGPVP